MRDKNGRFVKQVKVVGGALMILADGLHQSLDGTDVCCRCNRKVKKGSSFHKIKGAVVGLECMKEAEKLVEHTSKKDLLSRALRRRYNRYVGYLTRQGLEKKKLQASL